MIIWVTLNELYFAYLECRKHKRNSKSCAEFEQNEAHNLYVLWKELNDGTYKIGYSIAFCVTRPKVREVFAANFRDRIVHHLLVNRIEHILDTQLISNTFSCRNGKGTLHGIESLKYSMDNNPYMWNVKLDMKGFFYTIDKKTLWRKLKEIIKKYYIGSDINKVLWLTKMIVMHEPQNLCIKHGDISLWDKLSDDRSLFTCKKGFGLAIGNLTSQLFANFYLMDFDNYMFDKYGDRYNRYVDDIVITGTREEVLEAIGYARDFLLKDVGVILHPNKVYIQPCNHGILWIGYTVKQHRLYCGNRTINNAFRLVDYYNKLANRCPEDIPNWIQRFAQRMNSYFGYMIHTNSYGIRYRLYYSIDEKIREYITPGKSYQARPIEIGCVKVKKKYKIRQILKRKFKRYKAKYRYNAIYHKINKRKHYAKKRNK